MDRATRAFVLLAASATAVYVLLGFWGCTALVDAFTAITGEGLDVAGSGRDLRPALVLASLELTVSILGIASLNRQLVATERLARWVRRHLVAAPPALTTLVGHGMSLARIDVVDGPGLVSFTYGFLRPRIVLSRELIDVSTPQELTAIIEHERYHARSLDPLKLAVARALPAALFFLPVLAGLRDRYILGRELAADRWAASRCGVGPLAGALLRATTVPGGFEPAVGAALGGGQLRARIEQLETGVEPAPPPIPRVGVAATAVSAVVVASLVAASRSSLAGIGMHAHAPPLGDGSNVASTVATVLCVALWSWVTWRVVGWLLARRDASFYYRG